VNIGIIGLPNEDTFKLAAEKGLEFIEFCINVGNNVEDFVQSIDKIKEWQRIYGVKVGSIGRWGSDRLNEKGEIIEKELNFSYQLINAADELGCNNFICGCNYITNLSYLENCQSAIMYLSKLIEFGKSKGVQVSTYNCNWNNFIDNEIAWTVIHGHLKDLGIKFDPSHSRYAGRDYLKEMKEWGERFYHVHIKGSLIVDGERFDDPPAGLDQTDWNSFLAILYAKKYNGGLSIEPHSHTWEGELGDKGVDYTINLLKKLVF
jgi:sugar phosphate isomerase/epimerase